MSGSGVMKRAGAVLIAFIMAVAMMGFTVQPANADDFFKGEGFEFQIYFNNGVPESIWITKYLGNETTVKLPTHILYEGKEYPVGILGDGAFQGNTTIKKVIIPNGYEYLGQRAFYGCNALEEVVMGAGSEYGVFFAGGINNEAFAACQNLKTYRFGLTDNDGAIAGNLGIGKDSSGTIMDGVTAYVKPGTIMSDYLERENSKSENFVINIDTSLSNPAAEAGYKRVIVISGGGDITPTPTDPTKQMGKDGTAYGEGASIEAANKALTALKGEGDKKGMVFSKLKFKYKKVAKTSITLGWSKPSGTAKVVIYGNKCGKSTKYVKIKETTGTSFTVKKVAGKAVKKGTYYKFVAVAVNKSGKVVSTSKTIHVATKGGKVTNNKAVTIKVKSGKTYKAVKSISVKKGKTKALKVKASKVASKLAVKKHIGIRYESSNKKIATVSSKGVVKGVKKGSCKVYAYAQNGVFKAITVKVK